MTYELSLKLKEAGFPQKASGHSEWFIDIRNGKDIQCLVPNLSQLIEACGDDFNNLYLMNIGRNGEDKWYCCDRKLDNHCFGVSPDVAVANLWLALNKK